MLFFLLLKKLDINNQYQLQFNTINNIKIYPILEINQEKLNK